jgi:SAM-dependent methyltransferase
MTAWPGAPPTGSPTTRADDCCVDPRIPEHFNQRLAEMRVDGELPEMIDVSRMLLRLLGDPAPSAPSVLELGCGSGALSVALVERGATRADGIDLSPDMIAAARERATQAGVTESTTFTQGDGAQMELAAHDWVVLDRVICCYPHMDRLLGNALAAAGGRIGYSVPTSRGWRGILNRLAWWAENLPLRLGRSGCPTFVHDLERIERTLADAGFVRRGEDRLGLWYAAVWQRSVRDP